MPEPNRLATSSKKVIVTLHDGDVRFEMGPFDVDPRADGSIMIGGYIGDLADHREIPVRYDGELSIDIPMLGSIERAVGLPRDWSCKSYGNVWGFYLKFWITGGSGSALDALTARRGQLPDILTVPQRTFRRGPAGISLTALVVRLILVDVRGNAVVVGVQHTPAGTCSDFCYATPHAFDELPDVPMYEVPAGTPVIRLDRSTSDTRHRLDLLQMATGNGTTRLLRNAHQAGVVIEHTTAPAAPCGLTEDTAAVASTSPSLMAPSPTGT
ncbi:hypothetical protein [Kutzneria buriramensis]|uniref:Uncharacterized protein n=1 Tax=Kutzneria buriramensis TaxID=1045776 RepID=A0A3E0GWD6_9PSEU|nr:hypothetical protein [Kutzneria buriramensis]REH31178.1 hypothetical protein BCF44_122201 [Kutzneria buriramensis]